LANAREKVEKRDRSWTVQLSDADGSYHPVRDALGALLFGSELGY